MKYKGLIWALTKGIFLIGIVALALFLIRENLISNKEILPQGLFNLIVFASIGAVLGLTAKICLKAINQRKTDSSACADNLSHSSHGIESLKVQSNTSHQIRERQTYAYPRTFSFLIVIIALIFFAIPQFGASPGKVIKLDAQFAIYFVASCIFLFGIYRFRFLIVVENNKLIVRRFVTHKYSIKNVKRIDIVPAGRYARATVILDGGDKINIDPQLKNYNELLETLKNRASRH